jgi:N-acetylglucosaminyl-diphospho-decaprenol L-rhamnosyltransferase
VNKKITVSLVSHQQIALCQDLVTRLNSHCCEHIEQIVLTHNLPEDQQLRSEKIELIEIFNARPKGFGANHNQAVTKIITPFALIINPDILFEYDFLAPQLDWFNNPPADSHPHLAMTSPVVMNPDASQANFARNLYTPIEIWAQRKLKMPVNFKQAAWLAGMCWLVKTDQFKNIGGFDERFFMYCEDADFCGRLRLADRSFAVCTDSIVIHDARRSSHRAIKYTLIHLQSALRLWTSKSFWRYKGLLNKKKLGKN